MNVITRGTIRRYGLLFPDAKEALEEWYRLATTSEFRHFADVRATFTAASWVNPDYIVFNIRGNHYRLITRVKFNYKSFFVKDFLTHRQYDGWTP